MNLISSYFDVAPSMSTHLPVAIWRKTVGTLLQLMQLLNDFPNISMDPNYDPEADDVPPLDPTNIDNTAPVKVCLWGRVALWNPAHPRFAYELGRVREGRPHRMLMGKPGGAIFRCWGSFGFIWAVAWFIID